MKKLITSVAVLLAMNFFSCQEKTKTEVQEATHAIGNDIQDKLDTIAQKTADAIDSTQAKTSEVLKKGADKLEKAGDNLKEESKK